MSGYIPTETVNLILDEIASHAGALLTARDSKDSPRMKLAQAVGRAAAIGELAKLGLKKIEG